MKLINRFLIPVILLWICVLLVGCAPQAAQDDSPERSPDLTQKPAETALSSRDTELPDENSSEAAKNPETAENTKPIEVPGPMEMPKTTEIPQTTENSAKPCKEVLESMTLEEKLGQLMVVGYPSNDLAEELIRKYKVGGIVLFSRNFDTFEELYGITKQLKEYNRDNPLPLWIALDEEGGTVSRLPAGKTPVPGARTVGSHQNLQLTKATGKVIGEELAAAGANLDFAPVVDIVDNPKNEFILKRSYGSTPETVSAHGTAFLEGLREAGIQGCAKHFPGHGATVEDSHKEMPVIPLTLEEWQQKDAVPFQAMIDAGVDMIMVGHLAYPAIDPSGLPASMSAVFLQKQLRERMGYKGLIITDDIEMQGYPQGEERRDAVITSFLAGVDLFAVGHTPEIQMDVLKALEDGVRSGRITQERLDASVLRIIQTKSMLKDIRQYSLEEAKKVFGSKEHLEAIQNR